MMLPCHGNYVASCSNKTIMIHSTFSGKVQYRADNVFAGFVLALCYLPNGSGLVACGGD
tara:strand:+ start:227 stop:403 length:177 start_codon:yes stop_codon:yes gene_type:complete